MKRPLLIAVAAVCSVLMLQEVQAQRSKTKPAGTARTAATTAQPEVTLGPSGLSGGSVTKRVFDSLAAQGLRVAGNGGHIQSFQFIYAERNMYEDSVGNPLLMTDYLTEYCYGDTLSRAIRESLRERTKAGDTAYFDQIRISGANGKPAKGKTMRFVLVP